jgi:hypothetical protein
MWLLLERLLLALSKEVGLLELHVTTGHRVELWLLLMSLHPHVLIHSVHHTRELLLMGLLLLVVEQSSRVNARNEWFRL